MSASSPSRWSRRDVMRLAGVAGATAFGASALAACGSDGGSAGSPQGSSGATDQAPADSLSVLCWEGYTTENLVKPFTEQYGTEVKSTFIGSNDELISLLSNGQTEFDLISPSIDVTQTLIGAGLVQPIDVAAIPSLSTTYTKFAEAPQIRDGDDVYGVPICWGMIPLLYDKEATGKTLDSWEALWDPELKGKITVWDDISTVYIAAIVLGFDNLYTLDDDQLAAVRDKMLEQKPLLTKYWANQGELTQLFSAREVAVCNSGGGLSYTDLKGQGRDVYEIVPKEGATAWVDNWMVSAKSEKLYTAQLWMEWVQQPEHQAILVTDTGYAPTNASTADLVDPAYAEQFSLKDPTVFDRLIFWEDVPNRQAYLDLLTSVKAA